MNNKSNKKRSLNPFDLDSIIGTVAKEKIEVIEENLQELTKELQIPLMESEEEITEEVTQPEPVVEEEIISEPIIDSSEQTSGLPTEFNLTKEISVRKLKIKVKSKTSMQSLRLNNDLVDIIDQIIEEYEKQGHKVSKAQVITTLIYKGLKESL